METAYRLPDGSDDYPLVYVRGVGYRPGQEVPIENLWGVSSGESLGDHSEIDTVQDPKQRFRDLGHIVQLGPN